MSITFKTTLLSSSGTSNIYQAEAIDENNNILLSWIVCANQNDDVNAIAQEGYNISLNPYKPNDTLPAENN
jgi:hypothetical protein